MLLSKRLASLAAVSLLWASSANAGSRVSADYARQVDTVQLRLARIEASQVDMEATVRRLEELQRTFAAQPNGADGGANSGAVRELRGELEVLQFEVRTLKESVDALATDLDSRLLWQEARAAQLERALGLTPPPMPVAGAPLGPDFDPPNTGGGTAAADPDEPVSAAALMELAVEHMQEGRQSAGRAVLQRLLSEFPNDSRKVEANYRIAETYFNEEKWLVAVTEFQKVVDRFPRDELASWSMLRQGEAFERRGQRSDAVLFWEGVIQRYPGTPAADEARDLLR